jgi:integrase
MEPDHDTQAVARREKGANLVFLNLQKIDALKARPGERRTDFWDRGLHGFGLRVYASGRKTFTVRYTLHGRQQRKYIGVYRHERGIVGGEVGFSAARAEAERIISEARSGRDPFISAALLRRADITTFEGLCQKYLADPAPGRKGRVLREATRVGMTRIINRELIPVWGSRDPNGIQPEEIEAWARGVAVGERRAKPAPYLANRSFDYMAMIYSWAIRRRLLRYTPFVRLEKPFAEQRRSRTFTNEELRRLFAALEQAPKQIAALWLMLFYTGNRLREALRMEWSWIDREKKQLILPAAVTKNGREHLVPLVPAACKLLDMLKELSGQSQYVFPGPDDRALNWVQRACGRIMRRACIQDGRHHDTRRVLQTNMAEMRVPPHVADMILNHAIKGAPKSRQHYDIHHYVPEKREALVQWVRRLTKILGRDPNEVMKAERKGYQGNGIARRISRRESYRERKARLAAQGRDLCAERRENRRRRSTTRRHAAAA